MRVSLRLPFVLATVALFAAGSAGAQENYEIQVYGSETMAPGVTMFELHSNFTLDGRRRVEDGLLPTYHAMHETIEITRGINPWSEIGVYFFTSGRSGDGLQYVGSHVRPRVRAPESWNWPMGASLSAEVGFQRREFSTDTWGLELRPIIDKQMGLWYASFNPTLSRSIRSDQPSRGFEFSPNATVGFDLTPKVNVAVEYYGALGPLRRFDPSSEQAHQLFGVVNLDLGPEWEFNVGYGVGLTAVGDRNILKLILGRRVGLVPGP